MIPDPALASGLPANSNGLKSTRRAPFSEPTGPKAGLWPPGYENRAGIILDVSPVMGKGSVGLFFVGASKSILLYIDNEF